jgi:NADPH2:quinone reductase
MKAIICRQFGPPESLVVEEVSPPAAGRGQVVISVKAASVNFSDVLIVQNKYQVKPPLPFSPGNELSGVVKTIGEGVAGITPGDRVIALSTYGAFAEEVAVDATRVVPAPEGMSFADAASFLVAYGTSHHALCHRADAKAGETLLVLGAAGGVGVAAIEIGKILGLRVIACASSPDKLAVCREHGADETIDYVSDDLRGRIAALTANRGVDIIYDPVGGAVTEAALRSSNWRARLLVVGFAAGEVPRIPLNLLLLMERSLIGVYWGDWLRRAPAEFNSAVRALSGWFREGRVRPLVAATYPLERAAEALRLLADRKVTGKAVVVIGE